MLATDRTASHRTLGQPKNDNNVSLHLNGLVVQLVRLITPLAHSIYCCLDKQRVTTDCPHVSNLPISANCCPKLNGTINSCHSGPWRVGRFDLVFKPTWRDAFECPRRCGQGCRS